MYPSVKVCLGQGKRIYQSVKDWVKGRKRMYPSVKVCLGQGKRRYQSVKDWVKGRGCIHL